MICSHCSMYAEPTLILTANRDHYRRFSNLIVSGHNFVGGAHWRSKIRCKCRAEKKAKSFFEDIVNISQKKDSISISLFVFKNEKQMYTSFKKFQILTTKICMNHYILCTVKKSLETFHQIDIFPRPLNILHGFFSQYEDIRNAIFEKS